MALFFGEGRFFDGVEEGAVFEETVGLVFGVAVFKPPREVLSVQVQGGSGGFGLELQVLLEVRIAQDLFMALRTGAGDVLNDSAVESATRLKAGLNSGVQVLVPGL